jgi:hypothetical protein
MLGHLRADLEEELRSRGVPVRVEYGPVAPSRVAELKDVVVVEYDPAGDTIGAPKALGGNPRRRFNRAVAALVRIHTRNTVTGARRQDHEDRAHRIVDQVLVSLDEVLRGGRGEPLRRYTWRVDGAAFEPLSAEPGQTPVGATYVLRISIDRGVFDAPWSGEAADEFAIGAGDYGSDFDPDDYEVGGGISSSTKVHGSTGEGAGETSCGA